MILLASASPRRHRLLEAAGIDFRAIPADVDEVDTDRADAHALARANARLKAQAVAEYHPSEAVLGADTVVALGDRILGKPRDAADAGRFLRLLAGTTHAVVTGLALTLGGRWFVSSVETGVTMRTLQQHEIEAYVASGEGMGKAGAYAIQETADRFVTRLDGPFDNVVGLPVDAVRVLMREAGL